MDLSIARSLLQERLGRLNEREEALEVHLRGQDGRLDADSSDRANFIDGDEVIEQLDDEGRAEIEDIQGALQRLDAGTYGTCARCGDTIAEGRLSALPQAALCIRCAS